MASGLPPSLLPLTLPRRGRPRGDREIKNYRGVQVFLLSMDVSLNVRRRLLCKLINERDAAFITGHSNEASARNIHVLSMGSLHPPPSLQWMVHRYRLRPCTSSDHAAHFHRGFITPPSSNDSMFSSYITQHECTTHIQSPEPEQ